MRILAVDDDPSARELVADFLQARGHEVEMAADGETALAMMASQPPDLVLLDLMMPGMTGMQMLQRVPESCKHVPVIVVTAVAEEDVGKAALRAGAIDYLTKPIDFPSLERAVAMAYRETGSR